MNAADEYFQIVQNQLAEIWRTQRAGLDQAAAWVAAALLQERFVYAFGSGHSHGLAEEIFYRAGGLARAGAILDPPLMLHESASGSS